MEKSCFRTFASSLLKRIIVWIKRQKFGYSVSLLILRGGGFNKTEGGPFRDENIFEKSHSAEKN